MNSNNKQTKYFQIRKNKELRSVS